MGGDLLVYQIITSQRGRALGYRYLTNGLGLFVMSCLTRRQMPGAAPPARQCVSTAWRRRQFAADLIRAAGDT